MARKNTTPRVVEQYTIRFAPADVLDMTCVAEARRLMGHLIHQPVPGRVVLDVSQIILLSSSALGMIIALSNALRSRGGDLALAGVSEETQAVLEITRLSRVITVWPDSTGMQQQISPAA